MAKVKDRWVIVELDASTYRCRGRTNAASLGIDTPLQTNGFALRRASNHVRRVISPMKNLLGCPGSFASSCTVFAAKIHQTVENDRECMFVFGAVFFRRNRSGWARENYKRSRSGIRPSMSSLF